MYPWSFILPECKVTGILTYPTPCTLPCFQCSLIRTVGASPQPTRYIVTPLLATSFSLCERFTTYSSLYVSFAKYLVPLITPLWYTGASIMRASNLDRMYLWGSRILLLDLIFHEHPYAIQPYYVLAGLHNPIILSSNPSGPKGPKSYPVDRSLAAPRTGSVPSYQPATYTIATVLVTLLITVPSHNRLAEVHTRLPILWLIPWLLLSSPS